MKGFVAGLTGIILLTILVLAIAGNYLGWNPLGLMVGGCRIMKPVWGFYKCEKSSVPIDITDYVQTSWNTGNVYRTYYCTNLDIARNSMPTGGVQKSCAVSVTSGTAGYWVYKICSGDSCGPYSSTQGGDYDSHMIYLDFGEYAVYSFQFPIVAKSSFGIREQYFQKQLIYHDWYGYESETKGVGCDIRAVLPADEWNKLPANSKMSLNLDERQNFVVGWDDFPVIGNYYTHPAYGDVICTPNHAVYKVDSYKIADEAGEMGVYTDKGGNCYLVPDDNPVAYNVACCPGETLEGYTCNNENKWVTLDMGECCRGGLCTALHCPGGGSDYCELSTHRAHRYECRESDGACVDVLDKYAECCPPDKGCSGDEFCNADYECEKKPPGLIPCPFECCVQGIVDLNYYQLKECSSGLMCCPGGVCKASCDVPPPADNYLWLMIPILGGLFGLIGYLARDIIGGIVLGVIGGLAGYLIYWVSTLAWWAQILLFIGLGGLGALGVYIFWGIIAAVITAVLYKAVG